MPNPDNPAVALLAALTQPQRDAIAIIKLALDCYNSLDGAGLFTGTLRYNVLAARAEICAVQARDLHGFWSGLLRKMQWPMPPKRADALIVSAISSSEQPAVLRSLATETVSIITLARMLHDQDKATRKALATQEREASELLPDAESSSLEGVL